MNWQPYDPGWLVGWLRQALPEEPELAAAVGRCVSAWRDVDAERKYGGVVYHFVEPTEFRRHFKTRFLDNTPHGPIALHFLDDESVQGLQFLDEHEAEQFREAADARFDEDATRYSVDRIAAWVRTLQHFRLCWHAPEDAYAFVLRLRYYSEADLHALAQSLGLSLEHVPPHNPKPVPGVPLTPEFDRRRRTPVDHLPHLAQPGWVRLHGQRAFVWICPGVLSISVSDTVQTRDVSDLALESAREIERQLDSTAERSTEPHPSNCITPTGHPHLWADA